MSIKLMSQVWELDLPHNQLLVALALADHGKDDGRSIYPSLRHVGWKCGYTERQVRRIVRELEATGLLVKTGEPHGYRGAEYRLVIEAGVPKPPPGQNVRPGKNVRADTPSQGGGHFDPGGADAAVSAKPSREPSEEPSELPADAGSVSAAPTLTASVANDAQRLADLLSSLVRAEARTPSTSRWCKPTASWQRAAVALMTQPDEEGHTYTAKQIEYAIRFVVRHRYWQQRIKSLPTLRAEMPAVVKDITNQQRRGGHLSAVDPLAGYSAEQRARTERNARRAGVTVEQYLEAIRTNPQAPGGTNGDSGTIERSEASASSQRLLASGTST
jgi:hypothetical protein